MPVTEVVVGGTLKPDGTLELDRALTLAPGRVTVILRQEAQPPGGNWWQFMQDARREMEAAGCPFMNDREVQAHVESLRAGDPVDDSLRGVGTDPQQEPA